MFQCKQTLHVVHHENFVICSESSTNLTLPLSCSLTPDAPMYCCVFFWQLITFEWSDRFFLFSCSHENSLRMNRRSWIHL